VLRQVKVEVKGQRPMDWRLEVRGERLKPEESPMTKNKNQDWGQTLILNFSKQVLPKEHPKKKGTGYFLYVYHFT